MKIEFNKFAFLPVFNKMAVGNEEFVHLKVEGTRFSAHMVTARGTIYQIQEIANTDNQTINLKVNVPVLMKFLGGLKQDVDLTQITNEHGDAAGLRITFNEGKSSHVIDAVDIAFPSIEDAMNLLEETKVNTISFSDISKYVDIRDFIPSPEDHNADNLAMVVYEDGWFIGVKDTTQMTFVQTINKEKDGNVNRLFFDLISTMGGDRLVVDTYEKFEHTEIHGLHIFIPKKNFMNMPRLLSGKDFKPMYDHEFSFSVDTIQLLTVLKRFAMIIPFFESLKITLTLKEKSILIGDGKSQEEIDAIYSDKALMNGWQITVSASRLTGILSALSKGAVSIFFERDKTDKFIKIVNEAGDKFFILRALGG